MRSAWVSVLLLSACASSAGVGSEQGSAPVTAVAPLPEATSSAVTVVGGTAADMSGPGEPASETTAVPAVLPEGFATTQAVVTKADGSTCEICLWLADTTQERRRGLMFVTDLGRADGMAFRYPQPDTRTFFMLNTVLPLSIAFFAPDGAFIESFDMEPCTTEPCPNYSTPPDILVAVEVPRGDLEDLGLVAGSTLELLDLPCDG